MLRSISRRLATLLFGGMLLACGSASTPVAQPAPTTAPTGAPASASNGAPPTAAPVQPAQPRAASATAPAAPPTIASEPVAATASGIPEGITAEGYHYLGRPDAPVTLVMYSDFL